jgi:hypothetical protein
VFARQVLYYLSHSSSPVTFDFSSTTNSPFVTGPHPSLECVPFTQVGKEGPLD